MGTGVKTSCLVILSRPRSDFWANFHGWFSRFSWSYLLLLLMVFMAFEAKTWQYFQVLFFEIGTTKQVLFCNFSRKVQQIGTILRSCEKGTWTKQEIFWEKGTTKHALFYGFERKVQQKRYYFVAFRVRYSKTGKLLNKFSTFLSFLDIAIIREKGKTKQVLFF